MYQAVSSRRPLLRLLRLATGILSLLLVAVMVTMTPSGSIQAANQEQSGTVQHSFTSAARRWQVPLQVLLAIGYVESRWEQRDGDPSLDNGYGIMHLVDGPGGTLERAARLTGLPASSLKQYVEANVEGGAALLSDISHKLNNDKSRPESLGDWYSTVAEYSGVTDPAVRNNYAQEVYRVMLEGKQARLLRGEKVVLPGVGTIDIPKPGPASPSSDDYGPAYWVPAHVNNYRVGRSYGPMNYIVIHDTEGSYNSAISWFQNPNSGVSAHYIIRSSDGQVTQMVRNADTGYHAGNWDYNVRSIGVEHEGFMNQQGWYTEAMYTSSSHLVRTMADRFNIRKDLSLIHI